MPIHSGCTQAGLGRSCKITRHLKRSLCSLGSAVVMYKCGRIKFLIALLCLVSAVFGLGYYYGTSTELRVVNLMVIASTLNQGFDGAYSIQLYFPGY